MIWNTILCHKRDKTIRWFQCSLIITRASHSEKHIGPVNITQEYSLSGLNWLYFAIIGNDSILTSVQTNKYDHLTQIYMLETFDIYYKCIFHIVVFT